MRLKTSCIARFCLKSCFFKKFSEKLWGWALLLQLKHSNIFIYILYTGSQVNNRGQNFLNNRTLKNKAVKFWKIKKKCFVEQIWQCRLLAAGCKKPVLPDLFYKAYFFKNFSNFYGSALFRLNILAQSSTIVDLFYKYRNG